MKTNPMKPSKKKEIKRRPVRKEYRLSPLNRRIEQIKRFLWVAEHNNVPIEKFELPFPFPTEEKAECYLLGLQDARILVDWRGKGNISKKPKKEPGNRDWTKSRKRRVVLLNSRVYTLTEWVDKTADEVFKQVLDGIKTESEKESFADCMCEESIQSFIKELGKNLLSVETEYIYETNQPPNH